MIGRVHFKPKYGEIYENHGGGFFRCIDRHPLQYSKSREWNACFQNIKSGWILMAHDIRQYADGRIDWAYSTNGHWPQDKFNYWLGKENTNEEVQMERA